VRDSAEQSPGMRSLPTVHMFWHGSPLSRLEQLCIASFLGNGHPVDLYAYDEVGTVPAGARLLDASQILPRKFLFRHRRTGSVGLFADWFRYRLLYERGGIWADTDIACLKPLAYASAEIFAWQDEKYLNNAVLGLPPGHELATWLAQCCENPNALLPYDGFAMKLRKWRRRYLQGNRRDRMRWGEYGPKGLTQAARHLGYAEKALPSWHFYPVAWNQWHSLFEGGGQSARSLEKSSAVHFYNNQMRNRPGFDKRGRFPPDSPFEQLCSRYLKSGD
jgi:hypothetical protein